jgi:GntR family transcriptional repressor for pyruvate dehydrogenase complex
VLRAPGDANAFESTVERLAAAIRLGVFTCGEQLPAERELSRQLGVSRVNLREAIAALRDADMVETRRGRGGGTVVTYSGEVVALPGSGIPDDLRLRGPQLADALEFRRVVEPGAAFLAATRELSAEQRAWLASSEADVRSAAEGAPHRIADSRLHLALAALSGSPMLIDAVTRAQAALHEMLARIPVLPLNIAHSHQQHRAVVGCVLAGDADGARSAMEEHCDATSALLRGLLG